MDLGLPGQEAPTLEGVHEPIIWQKIYTKLQDNEENWTEGASKILLCRSVTTLPAFKFAWSLVRIVRGSSRREKRILSQIYNCQISLFCV